LRPLQRRMKPRTRGVLLWAWHSSRGTILVLLWRAF
jgi:hypothetical protein